MSIPPPPRSPSRPKPVRARRKTVEMFAIIDRDGDYLDFYYNEQTAIDESTRIYATEDLPTIVVPVRVTPIKRSLGIIGGRGK